MDEGFNQEMKVIKDFMTRNHLTRFDMIHYLYHHYDWLLNSTEKKTLLFVVFCSSTLIPDTVSMSKFAVDHGFSIDDYATTDVVQIKSYREFLHGLSVDNYFAEVHKLVPSLFSMERYTHRINAPYPNTIQ